MQSKSFTKFGGPVNEPVEVDETFVGARSKNMHKSRQTVTVKELVYGEHQKVVVMGMLTVKLAKCGRR